MLKFIICYQWIVLRITSFFYHFWIFFNFSKNWCFWLLFRKYVALEIKIFERPLLVPIIFFNNSEITPVNWSWIRWVVFAWKGDKNTDGRTDGRTELQIYNIYIIYTFKIYIISTIFGSSFQIIFDLKFVISDSEIPQIIFQNLTLITCDININNYVYVYIFTYIVRHIGSAILEVNSASSKTS